MFEVISKRDAQAMDAQALDAERQGSGEVEDGAPPALIQAFREAPAKAVDSEPNPADGPNIAASESDGVHQPLPVPATSSRKPANNHKLASGLASAGILLDEADDVDTDASTAASGSDDEEMADRSIEADMATDAPPASPYTAADDPATPMDLDTPLPLRRPHAPDAAVDVLPMDLTAASDSPATQLCPAVEPASQPVAAAEAGSTHAPSEVEVQLHVSSPPLAAAAVSVDANSSPGTPETGGSPRSSRCAALCWKRTRCKACSACCAVVHFKSFTVLTLSGEP